MARFSRGWAGLDGRNGICKRRGDGCKMSMSKREGEAMKRLQGLAVAFALACVPGLSAAQDVPGQYDDTAATASATVAYDGGENVDAQGRRVDGDERYDDDRYEDRRYGGGSDSRYDDERYDERYARGDDREDR